MTDLDQDILFAEEDSCPAPCTLREAWKLLVVDDEEEVHSITRMVLEGFEFEGRGLEFLSAYSAEEGRRVFQEHPDIAVVLLDVVMETPLAGLELARYVRDELDNILVRIILRTGQPGQAPERQVITDYDVNDYKSKAELTAQKLFTSVTTAIRSYRDLRAINRSRQGLEEIIDASATLFQASSLEPFARGVLTQMTSLLRLEDSSMYLENASGFAAQEERDDFLIVAGTGDFAGLETHHASEVLSPRELELIREAAAKQDCIFEDDCYLGCFGTDRGVSNVLFLRVLRDLSEFEQGLLRIFATNVAVAFENLQLNHEIAETHREVIFTLGEIVESRALVGGVHVHRVAEMARLLGELAGLDSDDRELLRLAMPMHDVGKVAIPDKILLKGGPLDALEQKIMQGHPRLGYEILNQTDRPIMQAAARIALEHQEAWDGSGYPQGLKGEDIHVFSRIARVVDVFDSLLSRRIYKEPWSVEETLAYLAAERGKIFDPRLVDIFLEHSGEFLALREGILTQIQGVEEIFPEKNA